MDVTLVLFKKGGGKKTFILPRDKCLVGRGSDCDIRIPLLSVSRRHCEIRIEGDKLLVHDLGSRNGTFVNGTLIENASLRAGDYIQIGPLLLGIQLDGIPEELEPPDYVMLHEVDEHSSEGSTLAHAQEKESVAPELDIMELLKDELPGDAINLDDI